MEQAVKTKTMDEGAVAGEFETVDGERFYVIRNVDTMAPFFMSIVSSSDHWLFISSTGGLTAGRVSPETALFPYVPVDRIHESAAHTGSKTMVRVKPGEQPWEPFNREHDGRYSLSRHLYKSVLGNKLCFEEINHDLRLAFRYTWCTSDRYGFVRQCELRNLSDRPMRLDLLDGLRNILPAGTPGVAQSGASNLVDAYKWTELDEPTGLAMYALYSGISDRAEPCESLKANTAFCLGLEEAKVLLCSQQLGSFRAASDLHQEARRRGVRGAYFVCVTLELAPQGSTRWQIVADIEQSQSQVVALRTRLRNPSGLTDDISDSIDSASDELARLIGTGDGFQASAEENVTAHHYASALFNILRGGVFDDQHNVSPRSIARLIGRFNRDVCQRHRELLEGLPDKLDFSSLLSAVKEQGDLQLERLCREYLPIRFGRRHGDPSRPWNRFTIKLKDEHGNRLLSYEGNWRDIFQNWEALTISYPEFVENVIAKFVNASTIDGYNPYRISDAGIDWEVEEPDNPWSHIGYWGDHQIIYLQKLLELSKQFHPGRLGELLRQPIFSYANVPYRIKPYEKLLENPKRTVDYDQELAKKIERRVTSIGADGRLVMDADGEVYCVNLLEKLLVPLLSKLGNLVIDGGIWLNTQRPEWNDANNALVGQGLSMVTLYYLRRYVSFLQQLLLAESGPIELSREVRQWLEETATALSNVRPLLGGSPIDATQRYASLAELGQAASRYRQAVYQQGTFSGKVTQSPDKIIAMLDDALAAIDHSIVTNRREDGLYHAYNLLDLQPGAVAIDTLYPMLEGQVAALSAGALEPTEAVTVLEALFASDIYRPDQQSFMLYPDRDLPGFLARNRIPTEQVLAIPLLQRMLGEGDQRIVLRDAEGTLRFNTEFKNVGDLNAELDLLVAEYGDELEAARKPVRALYETVFNHQSFTGRSGTMFGFEGLGSVYWHMVSKLLLAVQENFFGALEQSGDEAVCRQLGRLYYRVRAGLGFNKSPAEFGAFPTDPYSHTPRHAGARQPGMTGQAKEDVLTRFGELGLRVSGGTVSFAPALLRAREFVSEPRQFRHLDVHDDWQEVTVPAAGLAFTWCQVPVVYQLTDEAEPALTITRDDGKQQAVAGLALPATESSELFRRSGRIRHIKVNFRRNLLFAD